MNPHPFALGYDPESAALARERFRSQGLLEGIVNAFYSSPAFLDDRPLPESFSLAKFRHWPFDQGPVGTCWINAAVQGFQVHTAADGTYVSVALSRRFVGYWGGQLEGGSNPANGGCVSDAYDAMGKYGACHEEIWTYKPDAAWLGVKPPANVVADGALNRLSQIADVARGEAWKRAIFNGHPVAIGIPWPAGWDNNIGPDGRAKGVGPYVRDGLGRIGGHAVLVNGWDGDWWQVENSHGAIYHPLPAADAARITGYAPATPTKTFDYWTRDDWMAEVFAKWGQNSEAVTAAGLTGFAKRPNVYTIAKAIRPIRKLH